ncbi:MAG: glycosyltransferase [Ferrimicrobium sp.]
MQEPPLVALVVVAYHPGEYFEDTLASLSSTQYPHRSIVIVNVGGAPVIDDIVARILPEAIVVPMAARAGFAAAANFGVSVVAKAPLYLVCHDDVALAPNALAAMVEVAYATNAGVITPKMVAWDSPRQLLALGEDLDLCMGTAPLVEVGELDQGQHDEVREVAVAPGGAFLVRGDLFEALGGFDERFAMLYENVDLSVRARMAGARVVTAPHARVRHRLVLTSSTRRRRLTRRSEHRFVQERGGLSQADRIYAKRSGQVRCIVKLESGVTRVKGLALLEIELIAEALFYLITARPRVALAALASPTVMVRERASLRASRAKMVVGGFRDSGALFTGSWLSIRRLVSSMRSHQVIQMDVHAIADGDLAVESVSEPTSRWLGRWEPASRWFAIVAVLVSIVGLHGLIFTSGTVVGSVGVGGSVPQLVHLYFGGSGTSRLTGGAIAPTADLLFAIAGMLCLGHVGFALGVGVIAALLGGPYAMYRLLLSRVPRPAARFGAGLYALLPGLAVAGASASLVAVFAYALAPLIVLMTLSAVWSQRRSRREMRGRNLRLAGVVAIAFALAPQLILVWAVLTLVEVGVYLLRGERSRSRRLAIALAYAVVTAVVINLPWVVALIVVRPGVSWLFTGQVTPDSGTLATLFGSGIVGGWTTTLGAALVLFVVVTLFIGRVERLRRVRLAAGGAFGLLAAAAAAERGLLGGTPIAPYAFADLAMVLLVLAVVHSVVVLVEDLPSFRLGWKQLFSLAAAGVVVVSIVGAVVADSTSGITLPPTMTEQLSIIAGLQRTNVNTLWLEGSGQGLVRGIKVTNGLLFAVTNGGVPTIQDVVDPPVTSNLAPIAAALTQAIDGTSVRFGSTLSRLGIKNVAVLPSAHSSGPSELASIFVRQIDLRQEVSAQGLVVYSTGGEALALPATPTGVPRILGISVQFLATILLGYSLVSRRSRIRRMQVARFPGATFVSRLRSTHDRSRDLVSSAEVSEK